MPSWIESLELPALRLRSGRVVDLNEQARRFFGDGLRDGDFDQQFSPLSHNAGSDKEASETSGHKVRALSGPCAGRCFSVHRQEGAQTGEQIIVLLDVTRDSRLEEALTIRLREVNRAHRAGRLVSWELDLKRLRITIPHRLPEAFGSILRVLEFEEAMALFHPEDVGEVRNAIRRAMDSGRLRLETRVVDAAGQEHWVLLRGGTTKKRQGEPRDAERRRHRDG